MCHSIKARFPRPIAVNPIDQRPPPLPPPPEETMIVPADCGEANGGGSEVAFIGGEGSVRNWVWRETDGGPENYRRNLPGVAFLLLLGTGRTWSFFCTNLCILSLISTIDGSLKTNPLG